MYSVAQSCRLLLRCAEVSKRAIAARALAALTLGIVMGYGAFAQSERPELVELLRYSMHCPVKATTEPQLEPVSAEGVIRRLTVLKFIGDDAVLRVLEQTHSRKHNLRTNRVNVLDYVRSYSMRYADIGYISTVEESNNVQLSLECLEGECIEERLDGDAGRLPSIDLPFCDAKTADNARFALEGLRGPLRATLWDHNGSLMKLIEDGQKRRIYYEEPSDKMADLVRKGDLLFEGTQEGAIFSGKAASFSSRCSRPLTYDVTGAMAGGRCGASIKMFGESPQIGSSCNRPASYKSEELIFRIKVPETCRE
jgi:hypothetical protein